MIQIENEQLTVQIDPLGAQMHSIKRNAAGLEYLWQGDPKSWKRQAPVLFPFVGRLKDDQYEYQGKVYHQTQHGFARDREFKVVEQSSERVVFELRDDEKTRAAFPFAFVLTIAYQLDEDRLLVSYRVENPSNDQTLIYALGAHPGFNVPVDEQGSFETTQFSVSPAIDYQQVKLVAPGPFNDLEHPAVLHMQQPIQLDHELFDEDALIFATKGMPFTATLTEPQTNHGVHVQVNGAPFVGVWSPYPAQANLVCVEPWWGIADSIHSDGRLEDKQVMSRLASGKHEDYAFAIQPF
ncbi:aldose 1-epimerase family protein [Limosilactobacillus mucosae]|uniref:Aldose 1-epimerase n=2 Tax=Limosilactobacillus mucosae TaxID=97478 RepID=A0A0R1P1P0_LIMMU|nr:aldose 1-epimerase family protein [Limosilactobacillus mucosae]KRL26337.1 aldose 1-epimerase [Limosilactobacillus mucosae DSM 13345]QOL69576.1 aldose 1-epimerase family protein [Limosilactobacillus mucosae]